MSQTISQKLDVNREYKVPYGLKAERCVHRITFNPSSASPMETLYISIPKLSNHVVIIPGSVGLLFNLNLPTSGQANNTIVNNLGRCLIQRMKISLGGELLQDTNRYDLYQTYHDLFMTKEDRENKLLEGISDLAFRKHRTAAGDKGTDAKDVALNLLRSMGQNLEYHSIIQY